jgi:hypothetical protein
VSFAFLSTHIVIPRQDHYSFGSQLKVRLEGFQERPRLPEFSWQSPLSQIPRDNDDVRGHVPAEMSAHYFQILLQTLKEGVVWVVDAGPVPSQKSMIYSELDV